MYQKVETILTVLTDCSKSALVVVKILDSFHNINRITVGTTKREISRQKTQCATTVIIL